MVQSAKCRKRMGQRMNGPEVFSKSDCAHHGRDLHFAASVKVVSMLDGARQ